MSLAFEPIIGLGFPPKDLLYLFWLKPYRKERSDVLLSV